MNAFCQVDGLCPECGQAELQLRISSGVIHCVADGCPQPDAAFRLLQKSPLDEEPR